MASRLAGEVAVVTRGVLDCVRDAARMALTAGGAADIAQAALCMVAGACACITGETLLVDGEGSLR